SRGRSGRSFRRERRRVPILLFYRGSALRFQALQAGAEFLAVLFRLRGILEPVRVEEREAAVREEKVRILRDAHAQRLDRAVDPAEPVQRDAEEKMRGR